jgi:hypothetical protein
MSVTIRFQSAEISTIAVATTVVDVRKPMEALANEGKV